MHEAVRTPIVRCRRDARYRCTQWFNYRDGPKGAGLKGKTFRVVSDDCPSSCVRLRHSQEVRIA